MVDEMAVIDRRNTALLANAGLPLTIGTVIYLTAEGRTFISDYFHSLGIVFPHVRYLPFIRNYVCDFLWAYAIFPALALVTETNDKKKLIRTITVALLLIILLETMQLVPFFVGTFDLWDIVTEIIALFLSILITNMIIRRFKNEKGNN